MQYTKETIEKEFPCYLCHDLNAFCIVLNDYYDKVKALPIETVKSLLPIDKIGPVGTYFKEDWMVRFVESRQEYMAEIYDWCGDRSTTNVVHAQAKDKDMLYRRLLVAYIFYLKHNSPGEWLSHINEVLKK